MTLMILTSFVFSGVLLYAIGVSSKVFLWMLFGRVLLGIGSESLTIAQSTLVTKYFLTADLSFALAVTMSMSRLTSVINYMIMPKVAEDYGVPAATWMAFVMCVFSLCAAFGAVMLDRYNSGILHTEMKAMMMEERVEIEQIRKKILNSGVLSNGAYTTSRNDLADVPMSGSRQNSQSTTPRGMKKTSSNDEIKIPPADVSSYPRPVQWILKVLPIHCVDFPRTFWLTTWSLICYSTATITFIPMAPSFLELKYFPGDFVTASTFVSVPDSFSVIMLPLAGIISDRLSKRQKKIKNSYELVPGQASLDLESPPETPIPARKTNSNLSILQSQSRKSLQILLSGVSIFLAHLMFTFTDWYPMIPLLTLGVGYAGYGSVLYSLMAELVAPPVFKADGNVEAVGEEDGRVASAYGVSGCMVNTIFFLNPLIVAFLLAGPSSTEPVPVNTSGGIDVGQDEEEMRGDAAGYFRMEAFFSVVALCGVISAYRVYRILQREIETAKA